jgi:arsenate reductase-like glutaredoxin family protein
VLYFGLLGKLEKYRREMDFQIIGTKKDPDTRKAQRFFKLRGEKAHFVDLRERPLKRGELENIGKSVSPEDLLDTESKAYKQKGLQYMEFDPLEEILENPLLLKMPVVRCGKHATVGYAPKIWEDWIKTKH